MWNDLLNAKLKYCSQRKRRTSPFFPSSSSSSAFLVFQGEPIASEPGLFSHGPLVHLILTRWRASDNGTVKCASREEGWRKIRPKIQFGHLKRSHLLSSRQSSLTASVATAGKLNKHRHSYFAVQIYCSEGLGAARRPRCGSAAAGQSCTSDSEEQPSDGLLHYPFLLA